MEGWRAEFRLGDQFGCLEGKFDVWRADLMFGGLIEGLEGRFEVWRADLTHGGADLKPEGLIQDLGGLI